MRVLHIGKYFAPFKGGVETYLRDVMAGLQAQGVECMALVHNHQHSLRTRSEAYESAGVRFRLVRAASLLTFFFTPISLTFRGQLKRSIGAFDPDVIHVHLPNPSACWLLTVGRAKQVPLVVHWHSDVITTAQGPLMKFLYACYRPFERRLLRRAAAIIATSQSYLESSESLQAWPGKCHVVPLGLDPARIRQIVAEPTDTPSTRDFNVLAVGRLTYYKGFGFLIRAVARLDDVHVHIVGQGGRWRDLHKLAAHLGVRSKVTFHGGVPDARLASLFKACDCLCLPSIERTEAFGLVLLEAMFFGKPTVASSVPGSGMGWVVDDEITGLKVPPKDDVALANAIARLRDDRALSRRLGEAGQRKFNEQFDIEHSARSLKTLYQRVAGPRQRNE